jgi:ABC-type dipeptide/oligopeptide/nickel transport system permease component
VRFVLGKAVSLVVTVFVIVLLAFLLMRVVPGDPARVMLGNYATPESLAALREKLGLDRSVTSQLWIYIRDVVHGNLGASIQTGQSVWSEVMQALPYTVTLAVAGSLLSVLIGIPLGVFAALRRGRLGDHAAMAVVVLARAMPEFWLGILLLLVFALHLGWLPALGAGPGWSHPLEMLKGLVLPAVALAVTHSAFLARSTRASLLDQLSQEYVRMARAKGLSRRRVLYGHALRTALIPIVTVVGLEFASLLTGAVVVEKVFTRPGLGTLLVGAIENRDYPLVQGCILVFAVLIVTTNLLTDLAYGYFDPRVRAGGGV